MPVPHTARADITAPTIENLADTEEENRQMRRITAPTIERRQDKKKIVAPTIEETLERPTVNPKPEETEETTD